MRTALAVRQIASLVAELTSLLPTGGGALMRGFLVKLSSHESAAASWVKSPCTTAPSSVTLTSAAGTVLPAGCLIGQALSHLPGRPPEAVSVQGSPCDAALGAVQAPWGRQPFGCVCTMPGVQAARRIQ